MGNWIWNNIEWIVIVFFGIRFLYKDLTGLIYDLNHTSKYGDNDPSGNDNIKRDFHDYM